MGLNINTEVQSILRLRNEFGGFFGATFPVYQITNASPSGRGFVLEGYLVGWSFGWLVGELVR